jgi:hypothetical protein
MMANPSMKIMHDKFDLVVRHLIEMRTPPTLAEVSRRA